MALFSRTLAQREYRVFKKGPLLLCVFADEKILRTMTTCYDISSSSPIALNPALPPAGSAEPLLSVAGTTQLQSFSVDDLKNLAKALRLPVSTQFIGL